MRLLDLYCGVGGAAVGYHRAGFDEVVGVDIVPQPDYPFELHVGSALDFLVEHGAEFDAIHASPPCQAASGPTRGTNRQRNVTASRKHPQHIPAVRALLALAGQPSVIENVQGALLRRDLTLCGEMFGLPVLRHRYFELGGWKMAGQAHPAHRGRVRGWRHGEYFDGPYLAAYGEGGGKASVEECRAGLGIDWTDNRAGPVWSRPSRPRTPRSSARRCSLTSACRRALAGTAAWHSRRSGLIPATARAPAGSPRTGPAALAGREHL